MGNNKVLVLLITRGYMLNRFHQTQILKLQLFLKYYKKLKTCLIFQNIVGTLNKLGLFQHGLCNGTLINLLRLA